MATALSDLYPAVEVELPSCPEPLILAKLREVVIEFCNETMCWTEDLDPINVMAAVSTYDLDGQDANANIIVPVYVELDSQVKEPGIDYYMTSLTELTLMVEPETAISQGLEVTVALRLKSTATSICSDLYCDYWMAWAAGVKSKLMVMPNKKWTNLQMGARYNAEYWDGIGKAKISVYRDKMIQPLRAGPKYPFI
jgi:hypothetical protein